jgi:hypothetical protein
VTVVEAVRTRLDAERWHWQHGPIDIVAQADGEPDAVHAAHEAAWERFQTVLTELVSELSLLRLPVGVNDATGFLRGPVARRMWDACAPFAPSYITPMAAVAGSVAQELITCYHRQGIRRAWLNNGGDIALHLIPGQRLRSGVVGNVDCCESSSELRHLLDGAFDISYEDPVRGVATSGWRGRSLSLGIADSVTVLAENASQADAAATMIANAVNIQHPCVRRAPASAVRDDSDLGDQWVTVDVGLLPIAAQQQALQPAVALAQQLQARGLVWAAYLVCQSATQLVQPLAEAETTRSPLAGEGRLMPSRFIKHQHQLLSFQT